MKTEIRKAVDHYSGKVFEYEIGSHCTWEEREQQVKAKKNEEVFYVDVYGQLKVSSFFSVNKSTWQRCRKVVRKIREVEFSCALCGYFCNNQHHHNNWFEVEPPKVKGEQKQ